MKADSIKRQTGLKILKLIIITQILSLSFALIGGINTRLLILHPWVFENIIILHIEIGVLGVIYIAIVKYLLGDSSLNVFYIGIPYIIYWFIILFYGGKLFPTNTDPDDYGVGIIILYTAILQWGVVIAASIIGTCLNRRKKCN